MKIKNVNVVFGQSAGAKQYYIFRIQEKPGNSKIVANYKNSVAKCSKFVAKY